jgi:hypothetical protein
LPASNAIAARVFIVYSCNWVHRSEGHQFI